MASIWQNNKLLRKWEQKNFKKIANGNFNYNLAYPLEDPLLISIANNFNIKREYVYVGAGSSQFISAVVSLKCWNMIFLSDIEFALYKRSALLADKKVKFLKGITTNDFMSSLTKLKSKDNDLLCISSPRWFSGELFTKSQIKEILKIFNGTIIIDEAYIDYSDDENTKSAKGSLGIIDANTDLSSTYGEEVQTAARTLKEGEVSEAIQGSDGVYFVKCTSTDQESIKKELKTVDVDSPLLTYDDYMVYLAFNTYEINYHDDTIKQTIQDIVDENLDIRNDLRKENS